MMAQSSRRTHIWAVHVESLALRPASPTTVESIGATLEFAALGLRARGVAITSSHEDGFDHGRRLAAVVLRPRVLQPCGIISALLACCACRVC